jgi:hypothetical protein
MTPSTSANIKRRMNSSTARLPASYRHALAAAVICLGCSGGSDLVAPGPSPTGDPAPSSPGIFLGAAAPGPGASGGCFDAAQPDTDRNGLSDGCEVALAAAFAPELAYNSTDSVGREERWAAMPWTVSDGTRGVRLAYLLSYYIDLGTVGCTGGLVACGGHYGDSEAIWLDVYFNPTSQHWVLDRAEYSEHAGAATFTRDPAGYPTALEYPVHAGGYPRAYVARQKHANYASEAMCDAGQFGSDQCESDASARVLAGAAAAGPGSNLGSRAVHLEDCVPSVNAKLAGRIECYWTTRPFDGWQGREPATDPYAPKLAAHGF